MTKKEQRAQALAARRAMTAEQRAAASRAICERILSLPEIEKAHTVLSYMALKDEADLSALHEKLRERGARLCFPVSLPDGVMEVYEPSGWRSGAYGIREPDRETSRRIEPGVIDLALIPCVAFDEGGMRLGHGAGYYDRYLPQCGNAALIAVAFECQRLPAIVSEPHDRRMDTVVTETGIYTKAGE